MAEQRRVNVVVSGSVQGVFFRDTAQRTARELDLSGWVRNLDDGRVEAEFQGPAERVEQAIAFCREGPDHANVHQVEVTDLDLDDGAPPFRVR